MGGLNLGPVVGRVEERVGMLVAKSWGYLRGVYLAVHRWGCWGTFLEDFGVPEEYGVDMGVLEG